MSEGMRKQRLAVLALLALLVLSVYARVGGFAFVRFDDGLYVANNPQVQRGLTVSGIGWAFTSREASNWHPLTWLSLMLDRSLFGPGPRGFHLVNVALHLVSVLLLFAALARMTGAPGRSALAAALFAVHPLHVESVAWIAERKDVLSGVFWMSTMLAYLEFARAPGARKFAAVALLFALGLMAKPMLVTLPFVLLLLDWWPLGRLRAATAGRLLAEKAPLIVLSAASSAVTWVAQASGGSLGSLELIPFSQRLSNAVVSFARYLGKLAWPTDLAVYYTHPRGSLAPAAVALAAVLLAAGTGLAVAAIRRRPYLLAGWLWFCGALVPVIGLVQVGYQGMADRYAYLPSVGLYVGASWWLFAGAAPGRLRARVAPALAAVAALAAVSVAQLGHWRDSKTLFTRALAVSPDSEVVLDNLAQALIEEGDVEAAIPLLRRSVAINPREPTLVYNLGSALLSAGNAQEAAASFQEALRLRPDFAKARLNLGAALATMGRVREAVPHFQEALRLDPGDKDARANLARALALLGRDPR